MGRDAQRRMAGSNVLIIGLNGLGVEIAKNVILAGVKSVALFDNNAVTYEDLSSNFFLSETDLGSSRASISAPKLAELNPYVQITVITDKLSPEVLLNYTVVVVIDVPLSEQIALGEYCHSHNIAFIAADVAGVFGTLFCDFGKNFIVNDINGEPVATSMIASITQESPAHVTVLEDTRHNLETGDFILFSDIEGMTELNGLEFQVTVKDPFSFEIPINTSTFKSYVRGGYITQIKKPVSLSFLPLSQSIENPGTFVCDFVKYERASVLHLAFRTLHKFQEEYGHKPVAGRESDSVLFWALSQTLNDEAEENDFKVENLMSYENIIKRFSLSCRGQLSPFCALMGGITGQEVLKACSGKFMPINQWFYYDSLEALSDTPLPEIEVTPIGCRYDSEIMIFGKEITEKLFGLKLFVVGAGAIGCELLKNLALMGVGCQNIFNTTTTTTGSTTSGEGMIYVTDMDHIEKSNLSRQFLFRSTDINHPKSVTAAHAVTKMNSTLHITAYETKVASESENFFNDDFFESLNFVCTALDSVEARLYVDQRCLLYHTPLLESGTLGAKGHTQVVVPGLTEHYGATRDPPEKSIPVCTLKHFPNQIEHTIQWAREWFEEIYKQTPEDCNCYLQSVDVRSASSPFMLALASQQNMKLDTLHRVNKALTQDKPRHFQDCVIWARLQFEDMFSSKIIQLLHNFPLDRLTSSGAPFWSGAKKPPHPLVFDLSNSLHLEFLISCAILRAIVYKIDIPTTFQSVSLLEEDCMLLQQWLNQLNIPVFRPVEGVRIPTTEEEAKNAAAAGGGGSSTSTSGSEVTSSSSSIVDIDAECERLLSKLPQPGPPLLSPIEFEKDTDCHMRALAACANLRARNYNIGEVDLHTSRGIAGKITPAIATTTALVAGAICMELYKIIQKKPRSQLMNFFCNLAIPIFTGMEPEPPQSKTSIIKGKEWKWSQWDRIDIADGSTMTLGGLKDYLSKEFGVSLSMLSSGVSILYSDFMNRKKMMERMKQPLKTIVETITKKEITSEQKYLILEMIATSPESDDDIELPYLRLKLR